MGILNVLNVGAGDISLSFNEMKDDEAKQAISMLKDMAARGYAILVQLKDGTYARAKKIDASRGRYIIEIPAGAPLPEGAEEPLKLKGKRGRPKGRSRTVEVPIHRAKATGVARSAGG